MKLCFIFCIKLQLMCIIKILGVSFLPMLPFLPFRRIDRVGQNAECSGASHLAPGPALFPIQSLIFDSFPTGVFLTDWIIWFGGNCLSTDES